jgi:hypothetical protein
METKLSTNSPSSQYPGSSKHKPSQHQKQVFWQIWFPLLLTLFLVLVLSVLTIISSSKDNQIGLYWANISLMYMILISSFFGLLVLIILLLLIYGLVKLLTITPIYTLIAQTYVFRIASVLLKWANKIVQPVFFIRSVWAGFNIFLLMLNKLLRRVN